MITLDIRCEGSTSGPTVKYSDEALVASHVTRDSDHAAADRTSHMKCFREKKVIMQGVKSSYKIQQQRCVDCSIRDVWHLEGRGGEEGTNTVGNNTTTPLGLVCFKCHPSKMSICPRTWSSHQDASMRT